jgi:hypothetical protein
MPFIVFAVGLFAQFIIRQLSRSRNQEVQKEVFLRWLKLLIPQLEKQAKHQSEWTLGLKEAKDFDIADFPHYAIPLDRYKEFSLELMIKTFVLNSTSKGKENATLIQEISTAIEFFTQTELWSKDSFKMFVENLQGLLMNWNSALTKLKEMELELANACTSSGEKDQVMLYHAYFEIQRKYNSSGVQNNLVNYHELLVLPLIEKIINEDISNDLARRFCLLVADMDALYKKSLLSD